MPFVPGPSVTTPPVTTPPSLSSGTFITAGERMGVGGCPTFPRDNVFHADIRRLPVAEHSAATISGEADLPLRSGFFSEDWMGSRPGMPINVVDGRVTPQPRLIVGLYNYLSDLTGHPIPRNPKIEGHPTPAWDKHAVIVDSSTCISHEFFYFQEVLPGINVWMAETAVKINLRSNTPRPGGTAVASGGSILATLVRYDEVVSGDIDHVLGVSLPRIKRGGPVWPSFGSDGLSLDPNAPRMGSWLRLRSDADLRGLGPQATTIARALQDHGAVVGDTGAEAMVIGGENDARWDDGDLVGLGRLKMSDFEIVDPSAMMVDPATYQIR